MFFYTGLYILLLSAEFSTPDPITSSLYYAFDLLMNHQNSFEYSAQMSPVNYSSPAFGEATHSPNTGISLQFSTRLIPLK